MYSYVPPKPIMIDLANEEGFKLRQKAAEYIKKNKAKGLEAGSLEEQSYGILAEMVIREALALDTIEEKDKDIGYDILTDTGVKIDVKCRGGVMPFQEAYIGKGGILREAKHNFWARQVYDDDLVTDIYLMTHLTVPKFKIPLPGTERQRKWQLYICGWVSKKRVQRDGVYLPRGSLTEQGQTWFTYRGEQVEFYHKHLNGLDRLDDITKLTLEDVEKDEQKASDLHMTGPDAFRIASDMIGRGILTDRSILDKIKEEFHITNPVPPILHPNQYFHLLRWIESMGLAPIGKKEYEKLEKIMKEEKFTGLY